MEDVDRRLRRQTPAPASRHLREEIIEREAAAYEKREIARDILSVSVG